STLGSLSSAIRMRLRVESEFISWRGKKTKRDRGESRLGRLKRPTCCHLSLERRALDSRRTIHGSVRGYACAPLRRRESVTLRASSDRWSSSPPQPCRELLTPECRHVCPKGRPVFARRRESCFC